MGNQLTDQINQLNTSLSMLEDQLDWLKPAKLLFFSGQVDGVNFTCSAVWKAILLCLQQNNVI